MSGYGQDGPYASMAGHDMNYIALAGALDLIGETDGPPVFPLNLLGDFAGAALPQVPDFIHKPHHESRPSY